MKCYFTVKKTGVLYAGLHLPSLSCSKELRLLNVTSKWLYTSLLYWMELCRTSGLSTDNAYVHTANPTMAILAEFFWCLCDFKEITTILTLDLTPHIFTCGPVSTYDTMYVQTRKPWIISTKHWKIPSSHGTYIASMRACKHDNKSEFGLQRGQSVTTSVLNWQAHKTYQHTVSYICCISFSSLCITHEITHVRTPKPQSCS